MKKEVTIASHLKRIRAIKSDARSEASRINGRKAAGAMTKTQRINRAKKAVKARIAKSTPKNGRLGGRPGKGK